MTSYIFRFRRIEGRYNTWLNEMRYYSEYFKTKKAAKAWIAEQENPEQYVFEKLLSDWTEWKL